MGILNRKARRRLGDDGGTSIIEFAIVVPLLLAILFGVIDFGVSLNDLNSLRQGTREGIRRAVVADVGSYGGCTISGGGGLSADMRNLICLTKDKTALEGDVRVKVAFDASYTEGDAMIICTRYPLRSTTGAYTWLLDDGFLRAQVDMRIEQTDPGGGDLALTSFAEPGDWSWCG